MIRTEIERKWLVGPEGVEECSGYRLIEQSYLVSEPGFEIRLRRMQFLIDGVEHGEVRHLLDVKMGEGLTRIETDPIDLTEVDYSRLIEAKVGKTLIKRSWDVDLPHCKGAKIDHYEELGLLILEAEFDSEGEALRFVAPNWVAEEVTGDQAYYAKNMANRSWL